MPYPSCGGCQSTGFTVEQNFDHFSCHETREAATDPDLNAWYDRRATRRTTSARGRRRRSSTGRIRLQWEWSNADRGCVKTK